MRLLIINYIVYTQAGHAVVEPVELSPLKNIQSTTAFVETMPTTPRPPNPVD